jgi:hypothetical protein
LQTFRTDLRVGEAVQIDGGRITVRLEEKSGQRARLVFKAEDDVQIVKGTSSPLAGVHQAKMGLSPN